LQLTRPGRLAFQAPHALQASRALRVERLRKFVRDGALAVLREVVLVGQCGFSGAVLAVGHFNFSTFHGARVSGVLDVGQSVPLSCELRAASIIQGWKFQGWPTRRPTCSSMRVCSFTA